MKFFVTTGSTIFVVVKYRTPYAPKFVEWGSCQGLVICTDSAVVANVKMVCWADPTGSVDFADPDDVFLTLEEADKEAASRNSQHYQPDPPDADEPIKVSDK